MALIFQNNWGLDHSDKVVTDRQAMAEMGAFDAMEGKPHNPEYIHKILWKRKDRHETKPVMFINKIPNAELLMGLLLDSPVFECEEKNPKIIVFIDGKKISDEEQLHWRSVAKEKLKQWRKQNDS